MSSPCVVSRSVGQCSPQWDTADSVCAPEGRCQGVPAIPCHRPRSACVDLSPVPASRGEERGSLRRAVAVLDLLAAETSPPSVRTIAERTGLSKSAVQRILVELEAVDLAVRDPATRRFGLGPRTLALGSAYQRGLSLHAAAIGPMTDLAAEVGETVG